MNLIGRWRLSVNSKSRRPIEDSFIQRGLFSEFLLFKRPQIANISVDLSNSTVKLRHVLLLKLILPGKEHFEVVI